MSRGLCFRSVVDPIVQREEQQQRANNRIAMPPNVSDPLKGDFKDRQFDEAEVADRVVEQCELQLRPFGIASDACDVRRTLVPGGGGVGRGVRPCPP